jgi:hypothetical protein
LRFSSKRPQEIYEVQGNERSINYVIFFFFFPELPWDQPTGECKEYMAWKDGKAAHQTPWSKLDHLAFSLIRKILVPLPSGRSNIKQIKAHRWCDKYFDKLGKCARMYAFNYPSFGLGEVH